MAVQNNTSTYENLALCSGGLVGGSAFGALGFLAARSISNISLKAGIATTAIAIVSTVASMALVSNSGLGEKQQRKLLLTSDFATCSLTIIGVCSLLKASPSAVAITSANAIVGTAITGIIAKSKV